jgi:hypothetical protein
VAFDWIAASDFLSAAVVWEAATEPAWTLTPGLALLAASLVTAIDAGVGASELGFAARFEVKTFEVTRFAVRDETSLLESLLTL